MEGSPQCCDDYRKWNDVSTRDVYPTPRMDECLNSLGEAAFFSVKEANSGYCQVNFKNEGQDERALTSHNKVYGVLRKSFASRSAPNTSTFRRSMDAALLEVKWRSASVSRNAIIVVTRAAAEDSNHFKHKTRVLRETAPSSNLRKTFDGNL